MLTVTIALGAWSARSIATDLQTPRDHSQTRYVGSAACTACHPQHRDSWHRTFHRRMTQEASPQAVLGDFVNGSLTYGGVIAQMRLDHDQRPLITFTANGGAQRWQARVERTVGSHRIQQYLARQDDVYVRLPVAWDVENGRWIHMNGAFLTPDPELDPTHATISRADYDRHVTRWNDNCVFCHNVAPNPGLTANGRFQTRTAELGVACEACHGPGDEHVRINRDPLRRYALHLSLMADPTVANPARMSGARSGEVCGRCHGQRKASDIDRVLEHGDTFVPGAALSAHSTPLWRDTTLNGEANVFAPRFWNDGTPRLTAYEYQGLLQSPCAKNGAMTCESCHAMHDSDPDQQLRRDLDHDNDLCTQCHTTLSAAEVASQHSRHATGSPGNQCRACHMPKVVYGLIAARISHRIETPAPADNTQNERPDACTLCHVDRSRAWAIDALTRWRDDRAPTTPIDPSMRAEVATRLFGGDPIERAIAAAALGRDDAPARREERLGWLLDALAEDRYPAVRHIARRSLLQLVGVHGQARDLRPRGSTMRPSLMPPRTALALLRDYDTTELAVDARRQRVDMIARAIGGSDLGSLSREEVEALRSGTQQRDIEIGE